jgi:hypothetical protein
MQNNKECIWKMCSPFEYTYFHETPNCGYLYVDVPVPIVLKTLIPHLFTKQKGNEYKSIQCFLSRIPSYFGTVEPKAAAMKIIQAMRRDYVEVSIPGYLLYVGKVVR